MEKEDSDIGFNLSLGVLRAIAIPFVLLGIVVMLVLSTFGAMIMMSEFIAAYLLFLGVGMLCYALGRALILFARAAEHKRIYSEEVNYLYKYAKELRRECAITGGGFFICAGFLNLLGAGSKGESALAFLGASMLICGAFSISLATSKSK